MLRFFRFLLQLPLFIGGVFLVFVSLVHMAEVSGLLASEHNLKTLIKKFVLSDSTSSSPPKVRKFIRPRAVVVLDAGHGGRDGGTAAGQSLEKDLNMKVVHLVAEQLRAKRVRVVFTRQGDSSKSLRHRVDTANEYPSALFVSIHHNASTSAKPEGIETYYTQDKPASAVARQRTIFDVESGAQFIDRRGELLAHEIQSAACRMTQAVDRGIKSGAMVLTRLVSCPAVLVECGFLSNARERERLQDADYRKKLSIGISRGILGFLGKIERDRFYGVEVPERTLPFEEVLPGGELSGNQL